MENVTVRVKVKESEEYKGEEEVIELTLDFSKISEESIMDYAISNIVIKWQGMTRKKGQAHIRGLRGKDTYVVPPPGKVERVREMTQEEIIKAALANPEILKALMEKM